MDITIFPGKLRGSITVIPSKSQAHRLLICSAFSDKTTYIACPETNQDIEATAECLNALGAKIKRTADRYTVVPVSALPNTAVLNCRESGSTLRFMLPIVGALGVDATFLLEGRLPCRPLSPLWEEMERMGCKLSRPTANTIHCQGKLASGNYYIDGNISSQYITGLLFAAALLPGKSKLIVNGKIESKPYIELTQAALALFGVNTENYTVTGSYPFRSPEQLTVEGDWSNGSFWLAANKLGSNLDISGLDNTSVQGDRLVNEILNNLDSLKTVDVSNIPDLVPILAVTAAARSGITFTNIRRLRLKESDRVASVAAMLQALGAVVDITENAMTVHPATFRSCVVDSVNDHRIAMAAAIAATVADGPITVLNAQCVSKSYPTFWDVYKQLGGNYEQHIRSDT